MISDSEEITGKIVNILAYQAVITAQGENYTGEKDWALNKLRDLFKEELQKAREQAYKDGARNVRDFAQVEIMKRASQLRDDITTFTSETIHSELDQDKTHTMKTGGKQFVEFIEKQKQENSIGKMIAELEEELEACRKADQIIANWKFLYQTAQTKGRRKELLIEMLLKIGFSLEEANKVIHSELDQDKTHTMSQLKSNEEIVGITSKEQTDVTQHQPCLHSWDILLTSEPPKHKCSKCGAVRDSITSEGKTSK